jgi:hypothetical protein
MPYGFPPAVTVLPPWIAPRLVMAGCAAFSLPLPAGAAEGVEGITAVASKVSNGYVRAKLPDGSFQPEPYAFGEGGKWAGEISDLTIDKLHFFDVAKVIAAPLASQKYLPAKDPKKTRLLIMVYWGTTAVPGPTSDSIAVDHLSMAQANLNKYLVPSAQDVRAKVASASRYADAALDQMTDATILLNMENRQRNRTDFTNAQMLGYDAAGIIGTEQGNYFRGTAFGTDRDDLYSDIEENRYFVVLMAYDFQLLWKEKRHKLLWETRFSISERRNAFDKALPVMAQHASKYFGQASNGLLRDRVPEGNVEVRPPTLIEFMSEPKK